MLNFKLPFFGKGRSAQMDRAEPVVEAPVVVEAATQIPTPDDPKVKNKPQAYPSYSTSAKMSQTPLPLQDRRLATTDHTLDFRNAASTSKVIRNMIAASPEFSAAVFSYIRVSITKSYKAVAFNPDGTANPDATNALQQIIARINVLPDFTQGFNGVASLRSASESLAKEILIEGAMCGELVLDKARIPARIQPISVGGLKMQPDKDGYLVPVQNVGGKDIVLDAPTIFYVALDQDLQSAYASSPLEPAIKAVLFAESFVNDLQRVIKRAIHPRINVTINYEKFYKAIPPEVLNEENGLETYQNTTLAGVQQMINDLGPEDALVHYDFIEIDYLNNGNSSLSNEYKEIKAVVDAKLSSGTKTMPAVLGMDSTSNVASTQSMLFVKAAASAVQYKLNEFYSRMFTLAVRLLGHDVYVTFEYDAIDLRPDNEVEAFKSTKQSRILELLSLGMMTDEQACLELTGQLPPKGYKPLSGTMFKSKAASTDPGNDGSSNGGSALNKSQDPGSAGVKGQNKKSDPQKEK
jgi:hypothetical protein